MKQVVLLVFLHLCQAYVNLEECVIDYRSLENAWEQRLHDKLKCNYNSALPPKPRNGSDHISVKLSFIMKKFGYLSEYQEFSAFMLSFINWRDERLTWEPNGYGGITETLKFSSQLWLPGIKLYNSINDVHEQSNSRNMSCKIYRSGNIECYSWIEFKANCATDLKDWPFDTQVCSFEFGPWEEEHGVKVNLQFDHEAISFIGSEHGAEFDLINFSQEENQNISRQLKIHFTLARHTDSLAAIVIYPSILLSVLTLTTLFMDVRIESRLYLTCFSLMCHFYFLSELAFTIPEHNNNPPRILFYFRGSCIMTMNSIVLTYLLKYICEKETPVLNFIAITNEYAFKTYYKLIIHPRWETVKFSDKSELVKAWTVFANILNSAWIFVSFVVYITMCCVFIPTPSTLEKSINFTPFAFELN